MRIIYSQRFLFVWIQLRKGGVWHRAVAEQGMWITHCGRVTKQTVCLDETQRGPLGPRCLSCTR